ncbi:MAG: ATP synthase F0 subunit B [Thermodesulfobacteriota bacterium]
MISNKLKASGLAAVCLAAAAMLLTTAGVAVAAEDAGWVATDTYRVINFVVLAAILIFILKNPAKQFFGNRIRTIREQLEDLEKQKQEAENKLAEYNERLASLTRESEKIIEDYRKQGENLRDNILKEAEAASAKLEEQARKNIEREFAQAKLHLETEVFDKALEKAEEKLKRITTPDDQENLVREYLDKVVTK